MDVEQRARELLASVTREMYPDDIAKRYVIDKLMVDELDLISARAAVRAIIAALTPPEGWAEQHARDSKELRSLCASRDEARRERDIAKTEAAYMRGVLVKIAGYRLDQFAGPYDMASACVYDAENACPESPEVPDGRG